MKSGQGFDQHGRQPQPADPRTLEEIQRRTPRVAGTVELQHGPSGVTLTPYAPVGPPEYNLPFHPWGFTFDDSGATNAWTTWLRPGWVFERHIQTQYEKGGGLKFHEPQIGPNSMWELPPTGPPAFGLAGPISYNWFTFNTDSLGMITSEINVVSTTNFMNSTYHWPPDADGTGWRNGNYWVEIFRTDLENTNSEAQVRLKWGGHYPWPADLWAGTHPQATGAQPFIGFGQNTNRYNFRTHIGGHGHNTEQDVNYTDGIEHIFYGRNTAPSASADASGGYGWVYTGNTEKKAAWFNPVQERDSSPQVSVTQATVESPIIVEGNGIDGSLAIRNCNGGTMAYITWTDGLITSPAAAVTIDVQQC